MIEIWAGEKGDEIHLEFEIKVAAGALSNPVCLHGFDPIPLWKVLQGVQERLETETKTQAHYFVQVWKELLLHLIMEKRNSHMNAAVSDNATGSNSALLFQSIANLFWQSSRAHRVTLCRQKGIFKKSDLHSLARLSLMPQSYRLNSGLTPSLSLSHTYTTTVTPRD